MPSRRLRRLDAPLIVYSDAKVLIEFPIPIILYLWYKHR